MSDGKELRELEAKISKARHDVRAATRVARHQTDLDRLEGERAEMLAEMKRKRLADLAAQSPDLPGTWTWVRDGVAVDENSREVYTDGDGDIWFVDDDSTYWPIDVVRAVLAAHDAEGE